MIVAVALFALFVLLIGWLSAALWAKDYWHQIAISASNRAMDWEDRALKAEYELSNRDHYMEKAQWN